MLTLVLGSRIMIASVTEFVFTINCNVLSFLMITFVMEAASMLTYSIASCLTLSFVIEYRVMIRYVIDCDVLVPSVIGPSYWRNQFR